MCPAEYFICEGKKKSISKDRIWPSEKVSALACYKRELGLCYLVFSGRIEK